ncbi:MAG: GNAT family N-acetyltransferase [Allosphingosinicella sp.]|uniref:GNAT family N-acetyltransferase n=1 Tax=Allosphingosinicella sp. TaxID=2823234 RepID=UPI00393D13E0
MNARIREAGTDDIPALAALIRALGYEVDEAGVGARLDELIAEGRRPLVAEDGRVIGCLTWSLTRVLHRPRPVGRITMLVVEEGVRGRGLGRLLVEAAEHRLRREGCGLVEVTSNLRRTDAHGFYERLGFERTSYRFYRSLTG